MNSGTSEDELILIRDTLAQYRHPLITTHVNPDCDGIGSEMALYGFLREQGRRASVMNCSPTPFFCKFLDTEEIIQEFRPDHPFPQDVDLIIALDFGKWERMGPMTEAARKSGLPVLCIDHHPSEGPFGHPQIINDSACATGEIIFDLVKSCGHTLSLPVAESIYSAIMTDTGSFRFNNTNVRTHQIAGELLSVGVQPNVMYSNIYESTHPARLHLLGLTLSELKVSSDGLVGWIVVTQELLKKAGAKPQDTEDFVDFPRMLNGVQVSILFIELDSDIIRVSMRSKGLVRVNEVAMGLGGGGHPFAAGIRVPGPLEEAIPRVLDPVQKIIRESTGNNLPSKSS